MRKKPRFTHGRDNLRGDVSGKRFSTHAMERNVARIGRAGVETTKEWQVSRERMESVSGSDVRLTRVGDEELGHRGMTIIRAREESMVRW